MLLNINVVFCVSQKYSGRRKVCVKDLKKYDSLKVLTLYQYSEYVLFLLIPVLYYIILHCSNSTVSYNIHHIL